MLEVLMVRLDFSEGLYVWKNHHLVLDSVFYNEPPPHTHTCTHTRLSSEEPVLSAGLVFKAWRLHSHLPCIVSGWWCKGISVRRLWTSLSSFDLIFSPHFNQYSAVSARGTQSTPNMKASEGVHHYSHFLDYFVYCLSRDGRLHPSLEEGCSEQL